jgi:hypothetical protein
VRESQRNINKGVRGQRPAARGAPLGRAAPGPCKDLHEGPGTGGPAPHGGVACLLLLRLAAATAVPAAAEPHVCPRPAAHFSPTPRHPHPGPPPTPAPTPTPTPDIDREVLALQREEQKLIKDIKAAAKANNQAATRVLAKSLVRLRNQIATLRGSSAQLKGVGTNLTVRSRPGQRGAEGAASAVHARRAWRIAPWECGVCVGVCMC